MKFNELFLDREFALVNILHTEYKSVMLVKLMFEIWLLFIALVYGIH